MKSKKKQGVKIDSPTDHGLQNLLELNGQQIHFESPKGWWVKMEARKVEPSDAIPHGIRYSLTLHNPSNERVLGFDNAHVLTKAKKYVTRRVEWDHQHAEDRIFEYQFQDAGKLVEDFWGAVDQFLKKS